MVTESSGTTPYDEGDFDKEDYSTEVSQDSPSSREMGRTESLHYSLGDTAVFKNRTNDPGREFSEEDFSRQHRTRGTLGYVSVSLVWGELKFAPNRRLKIDYSHEHLPIVKNLCRLCDVLCTNLPSRRPHGRQIPERV